MSYATAKQVDASEIPVIDMAPLVEGRDARSVAGQIHRAVTEIGFFYVKNHPVSTSVIDGARAAAAHFFALPLEDKERIGMVRHHRGFLKVGNARMRDNQAIDLKESFVWGPELPDGDGGPDERSALRAPNLWPGSPPGFRGSVYPYLEQAQKCAVLLMGAFALALGRPADAFLRSADKPISRASLTYYPPQPARLGTTQFGVGPHTDFGCLTVLCQDDVGGLQVLNAANEWVTAHPIAGTLVVNVGDLLARWSNDRFRSTPHRVVNSSGRERYSLVLAYDPNAETLIDPAAFLPEGETPRYPPITCGAHITSRFQESFKYKS